MKILFITVLFLLYVWQTQGQTKFAVCQRTWTKIGCYKDDRSPSRPLPEMLLNDRDKSSKYHEKGYLLNWHKWRESLHSLACRCAEKARERGYYVFGLQFFGECWSGPFAPFNFSTDGSSKRCIMNLKAPVECVKGDPRECVGQQNTNYIYQLLENPGPQSPDVDGNYTNWSEWTACSKTCGGGTKSRERTCTNPIPEGNGRPCYPRLGEPEETVRCNEQECDACNKKMDVGIVVDSSSSVHRNNFDEVKKFMINLVDRMHVSHRLTHISVIRYNQKPTVLWKFNNNEAQDRDKLKQAIANIKYKPGGTRTDRALLKASSDVFKPVAGERPSIPQVLMVITDGHTHSSSEEYPVVLKPFKAKNVKVIAIGVGPLVDKKELMKIAMHKAENVIQVAEFDKLVSRIHEILEVSCAARRL